MGITAATSTLPVPDADGYFSIQNPGVTFDELNLKDVQKERKENEEQQRQAANQGELNTDQGDLVNYYPQTMTKEDRKRNKFKDNMMSSEKNRKPNAQINWMSELQKSKSIVQVNDEK